MPSSLLPSSLLSSLASSIQSLSSSHSRSNKLLTNSHISLDRFLCELLCIFESGMVMSNDTGVPRNRWCNLVQHLHTPLFKLHPSLAPFLNHIQTHPNQFLSGAVLKMALNYNVLVELIVAVSEIISQTSSLCTTLLSKYYNSHASACFFCRASDVKLVLGMLQDLQFVTFKLRIDTEEELERENEVLRRLNEMGLLQQMSVGDARNTSLNGTEKRRDQSASPRQPVPPQTPSTQLPTTTSDSHDDTVLVSHKRSRRRKKPKGVTRNHRILNSNHGCLLNENERTFIRQHLPLHLQHKNWNLIFSTRENNSSIGQFFEATHDCGPSLLIIQPVRGRCFGVFASSSWRGDLLKKYYGDSDCFLFSFNRLQHKDDVNVYRATHKNDFFLFSQKDSIAVGGGLHFGLWIDEAFECGFSRKSKTFNNAPLSVDPDFAIQNCECWSFNKQRRIGMEPFISGERVWHPVTPNAGGTNTSRDNSSDDEFDWGAEMDDPHQIGENGSFSDTSLDALTDRTVDTIGREMGSAAVGTIGDLHTAPTDLSSVAAGGDRRSRQVKVIHGCLLSVRADIMHKLPRLSTLRSQGYQSLETHKMRRFTEEYNLPHTQRSCAHLAQLRAISHMCNTDLDILYGMSQTRLENFEQRKQAAMQMGTLDLKPMPEKPMESSVFFSLSKYAARMERKNTVLMSLTAEGNGSGIGSAFSLHEESMASSLSRSTTDVSTLDR